MKIGSFGTAHAALDMEFGWFGATIRVNPDASDLSVADLMIEFGDVDVDSVEGQQVAMKAMSEYMVGQIHPDDRQQFWALAKANRQGVRDVMEVAKAITAAIADFRSGQSSGSSATPLPTTLRSVPASSSVDTPEEVARRAALVAQAAAAMPDRPDLRVGLFRSEAARLAAAEQPRGPLGLAG